MATGSGQEASKGPVAGFGGSAVGGAGEFFVGEDAHGGVVEQPPAAAGPAHAVPLIVP
ncbi:hypothetical protein [Kitasatospora sp. NPDC087314]|uniref:hypothetical protein n=1 Tax=Kitasatospora sp. NPDC087314 TaxID=3364068 RepID=UPI003820CD1B